MPARTHAAPTSGADAERIVAELSADRSHAALLGEPLRRARAALDRARTMDRAGDAPHAALLRGAAREWLDLGRDLVRAADAEGRATQAERDLDQLETKVIRERALLEETVARRGRAAEALERLEHPTAPEGTSVADRNGAAKSDPKKASAVAPSPGMAPGIDPPGAEASAPDQAREPKGPAVTKSPAAGRAAAPAKPQAAPAGAPSTKP